MALCRFGLWVPRLDGRATETQRVMRHGSSGGPKIIDLNADVAQLHLPAYEPCPAFASPCDTMRCAPAVGHVPRGFCGATGRRDEVQLVLVCAEPGDPHSSEVHAPGGTPEEQLRSAYKYAYNCFRTGKDPFHRNIRYILDLCFPGLSFDEQLRRSWLPDSVKCSARLASPASAGG